MNVCIIEDDACLASQIEKTFLNYSFANRVKHISSYIEYSEESSNIKSFDIVLLDINLGIGGEQVGFDILTHIRKISSHIPVIIISSHSEYIFLEEAFAKGAHDYMIKPFRSRELQIRIERWFRNYILSEYFSINKILQYYELTYDLSAYKFYIGENEIQLSKGSKYIFSLLIIYREKLVSGNFLIEKIWGYSHKDTEKNLRIKIMRLKKQLDTFGVSSWIHTLHGEGYMLKKISD